MSSKTKGSFTYSVVVPVYNAESNLVELLSRLAKILPTVNSIYEVILVNDGSRDRSWEVICQLVQRYRWVRGINLMRRFGQHNALLCGIQAARFDVIVTLDDDLQNPPEEIPKLLDKLAEGYDLVYGKTEEKIQSTWRNVTSKVFKTALGVVPGAEMVSHSTSFRAFKSVVRRGFEQFSDPKLSIDVLLSWCVARVTHVPVEHHGRRVGKSGYTLGELMMLAFTVLIGYSTLPLRIASGIGLLTSLAGFSIFLYVVIRRLLQTEYVPGFAFLASEIALFAGLQLFAIGVIGEYLARLHFRTMGKPAYVIRETVGEDSLDDIKQHYETREEVEKQQRVK